MSTYTKIMVELHGLAHLIKDEDIWVATFEPFSLASQGNTAAEAKKNLKEAINIFIEDCIDRGTFEEVLRESGFIPTPDKNKVIKKEQSKINTKEVFRIKIPVQQKYLLASEATGGQ